jgi:uncharacterized membrane protein
VTQADVPEYRRAPLHPGLVSSGATLLIAAFVTDILYWQSTLFQWNNFSAWLLAAGLVVTALAALALVFDLLLKRVRRIAWIRFAGLAVAALLSLLNAFVHSRDAYTAVVPEGIILSAVVTIFLLAVGLGGGWSLEARRSSPLLPTRVAHP